ncbi:hypothetical protein GBA52_028446 [Prunus armeniaca]|nr:hypothetical protein GBA52_028446 [Prunus armeniaca]
MGKPGRPFHHKESGREWLSSELSGSNGSKWSGLETNDMQRSKHDLGLASREPLPGSRGSHKIESINKGSNRYMDDSMVWDGDGNCSTRMSPGLDEWNNIVVGPQKVGVGVEAGAGAGVGARAGAGALIIGYRRESVFLDRNRSRSGVSAQLCKDFYWLGDAGELFNYDDSWESRHRKGGASKYSPDAEDYPLKSGRSSVYCTDFAKGSAERVILQV